MFEKKIFLKIYSVKKSHNFVRHGLLPLPTSRPPSYNSFCSFACFVYDVLVKLILKLQTKLNSTKTFSAMIILSLGKRNYLTERNLFFERSSTHSNPTTTASNSIVVIETCDGFVKDTTNVPSILKYNNQFFSRNFSSGICLPMLSPLYLIKRLST